jgi:hypothetical protein
MAKRKFKPLSFSTTIRNPERIPKFLACILPYENEILTSEIIHEIVKMLIREKEYRPRYILENDELKAIYKDSDKTYSDKQIETIIKYSPQKHKEAGFKSGWDSRFDTWYKMLKELGFIKYKMGAPIQITETGHMLIDDFNDSSSNSTKTRLVFLNALMKYQTNNPLRKISNENAPLPLLLNVLKYFKEDEEETDAGIARQELPILICWTNNDAKAAYLYIKNMRKEVGFKYSDEYIYDKCLSILGNNNKKYLKMSKICHESVDEYIRKMRMTNLVSLRGNGRFLDINSFEWATVNYIIENYTDYLKYEDEDTYIEYMCTIDSKLFKFDAPQQSNSADVKQKTLYKYASTLSTDVVQKELKLLCKKQESTNELFRFIPPATRLEFLTSIVLVQCFKSLDVKPNYAVDDEGLPTFTAGGGLADIECTSKDYTGYVEVTLQCSKVNQVNNEIIPISRHLLEAKQNHEQPMFTILLAPNIHSDTKEAADWQRYKYGADIRTVAMPEFLDTIHNNKDIELEQVGKQ